ncbi:hypothetical protein [Methanosphaerula palustris]|uniref:Uncharacterized protein n=1 Tax=Methanosphaerula palustris (strain ATCC BAA-1556 / DSM 19958 / E1-9c) TaxID=521011 RepID=B8GHV2_METPE|nr:hypothetical protein [Methanosphaerula palustris]ACL16692.1 hypothetical protein Mpal_1360 [Methanosphaerula palustris E1-9c]
MTNINQIIILTSDTDGISAGEITIAGRDQGRKPPWIHINNEVNR